MRWRRLHLALSVALLTDCSSQYLAKRKEPFHRPGATTAAHYARMVARPCVSGRYCWHGEETWTAEADRVGHLQIRRQAQDARHCRGCQRTRSNRKGGQGVQPAGHEADGRAAQIVAAGPRHVAVDGGLSANQSFTPSAPIVQSLLLRSGPGSPEHPQNNGCVGRLRGHVVRQGARFSASPIRLFCRHNRALVCAGRGDGNLPNALRDDDVGIVNEISGLR